MFCERCKKEEATIHLTEIIKEERSEVNLCESCAKEIGLNSKLSKFSISLPDMLSFMKMDELPEREVNDDSLVCQTCGMTFSSYARQGKLGCSDCYNYLEDAIVKIIKGYHSDKKHIGKIPKTVYETDAENKISADVSAVDELQERLRNAVSEERYEEAAILRDKINSAAKRD